MRRKKNGKNGKKRKTEKRKKRFSCRIANTSIRLNRNNRFALKPLLVRDGEVNFSKISISNNANKSQADDLTLTETVFVGFLVKVKASQ